MISEPAFWNRKIASLAPVLVSLLRVFPRAYDSADGVMDLPADASGRALRRVALNCFFDTLLFCGAILLLANSSDKEPGLVRGAAVSVKPGVERGET